VVPTNRGVEVAGGVVEGALPVGGVDGGAD